MGRGLPPPAFESIRVFLNRKTQLAGRIVLDTVMHSDYGDNRVEQRARTSFQTEMTGELI